MKYIHLHHFRCFVDNEFHFRRGVNLLVGDNGSGKTSLLKACKYVMSSFFAGFSDENTKWEGPEEEDFTANILNGEITPDETIQIGFSLFPDQYDSVYASGEKMNPSYAESLTLKKAKRKNSKNLVSGITYYRDYARVLQDSYFKDSSGKTARSLALPLFAAFSTEDIHSSRKLSQKKFRVYAQKPSFGYYECLEGNGLFSYWLKRLLVLTEGGQNQQEVNIVKVAVKKALGEKGCGIINDVSIRPMQGKVYFKYVDGRTVEAELLSDGYKRLVNIVVDLAFRCSLLNRSFYGEESTSFTRGTILIDEIDMHLHPSLQARVLKGLHYAFPGLQIIATTHAPIVMSGVESNEENGVWQLKYDGESYICTPITTYGLDASTIIKAFMHQPAREEKVDKELKTLLNLVDEEKYEEAKIQLQNMKKRFGSGIPELSEVESMLTFYE